MAKKKKAPKQVEAHTHDDASRKNIPSAEMQPIVDEATKRPIQVAYERRNRDLDPQLIWRGKYPNDDMDQEQDLVVNAPPLYIQEKVHPKVLIDDLVANTQRRAEEADDTPEQLDLFGDFNGVPAGDAKTEFYQHDAHWTNRMILGDSLQVMASLAEREGLRGKVQCIYFDPPYGIKFNSNFQWSTDSRAVKDGKLEKMRQPEQVKAFRDTWQDGINSYLNYLLDRLTAARNLLSESGSVFFQIGDENFHLAKSLLDEVFGSENSISTIVFTKTTGLGTSQQLPGRYDFILWYAKKKNSLKYRQQFELQDDPGSSGYTRYDKGEKSGPYMSADLTKPGPGQKYEVKVFGRTFTSGKRWWGTPPEGMERLKYAERLLGTKSTLRYKHFFRDFPLVNLTNLWTGVGGAKSPSYVVETNEEIIKRCVLLATDPGDLVLDPTCGSGTTAVVSEQWGRRWITIDTSRVAIALARARVMGAKYPFYLLADSIDGKLKELELTGLDKRNSPSFNNLRHGFVLQRQPKISPSVITNNAEINVIYDEFQKKLEPLRLQLNEALGTSWEEWELPREPEDTKENIEWTPAAKKLLADWWKLRIARQKEIDASIAAKADVEYLYDKPYEDKSKVRVAGPFTVESISPHRMLGVDENDEPFDQLAAEDPATYGQAHDFAQLILNNLEKSGVQQDKKDDRIQFDSLTPWPGAMVAAEGIYHEADGTRRRAAIHIGPEFGSVSRADLVDAAREAADAGFDLLIACGFNFDAHSTEFSKLGRLPVLKARMNADLHMAQDLAATGAGNLFVIFGEPDVALEQAADGQYTVQVRGVDIFDPRTGKVRSDDTDGIACWFVDTNYNGESFFVRHAYFLGANDPYKSLKRTLKAEVDREAWESLYGDTSRPFRAPETGRIAVKIINHLGDEVMKVLRVG